MRALSIAVIAALALSGCRETTAPRDTHPPAAPRGFFSITGDNTVYLFWLDNTERDVAGYRIYEGPCDTGPGCPYTEIGFTGDDSFTVTGLPNGVTRYYAVAAVDEAGNESELSEDTVFDTPRPEGLGAFVLDFDAAPQASGFDWSTQTTRAWDDAATDMIFERTGSLAEMFVGTNVDIQDAGYASSLDAVDFAPSSGWSPTGAVELIEGHAYVVWTADDHYAKFRVTDVSLPASGPARVTFDWAYQVDRGNRELRARPARTARITRGPYAAAATP